MRFVDTAEGPADPIGEFVSAEQPLGLDHLSLAVNPFGLDGVEPRTLLGKQAGHYPHSAATIFDLAVVGGHPVTHLMAFMPAGVVPDQKQGILAPLFELLAAPPKKLRGYGAHRPTINEPQPALFELGHIHPVASECLRLGVVLSRLLLQKTRRVCGIRPRVQARPFKAGEPGLVLKSQSPLRMGFGEPYQPISSPFLRAYSGSGLSIHRLARSQRTPSLARVARTVSPVTRSSVSPRSKLTSAAYSNVHRLLSLPNSLGERRSISRKASLPSSSKAARVRFGREEPGLKASRPRRLKSWMASRTVCGPHPKERAICGACSPLELARSIWHRRRTKASEERNPASNAFRSLVESVRTKIGGFMALTIAHNPEPILNMH